MFLFLPGMICHPRPDCPDLLDFYSFTSRQTPFPESLTSYLSLLAFPAQDAANLFFSASSLLPLSLSSSSSQNSQCYLLLLLQKKYKRGVYSIQALFSAFFEAGFSLLIMLGDSDYIPPCCICCSSYHTEV